MLLVKFHETLRNGWWKALKKNLIRFGSQSLKHDSKQDNYSEAEGCEKVADEACSRCFAITASLLLNGRGTLIILNPGEWQGILPPATGQSCPRGSSTRVKKGSQMKLNMQ